MDKIYLLETKYEIIKDVLDEIIKPEDVNGKTILVKPNIRSAHKPESAKTTHPFTLGLILRYLKEHYSNRIIVADSSIIGIDTYKAAEVSKILQTCIEYQVEFMDIRNYGFVEIPIRIYPYTVEISKIVISEDIYFINMPKLKSTYGIPLSLSVKNLKGLLSDKSKLDFHSYGLDELLLELHDIIKPDMNIIDGYYSLSLDKALPTNIIICSRLYSDLDAFIAKQVGIDNNLMKYMEDNRLSQRYAVVKKGNYTPLSDIKLEIVSREDFLSSYNVELFGRPCSSCTGCLFKALKKCNSKINLTLASGSLSKQDVQKLKKVENKVVIGNCAIKALNENENTVIKGCPPLISDIIERLTYEENCKGVTK